MLTHGNLLSNITQAQSVPERVSAQDVVYGVIPAYHIFGLNVVLGLSLSVGSTCSVQRFDPATATDEWRTILRERLRMFRAMREDTVARLGEVALPGVRPALRVLRGIDRGGKARRRPLQRHALSRPPPRPTT